MILVNGANFKDITCLKIAKYFFVLSLFMVNLMIKKSFIAVLAISALIASMFVMPALATAPVTQHFEGFLQGGAIDPQPDDYHKIITEGGTVHTFNLHGAGIIKIWFGKTMAEAPSYVGTWATTFQGLVNINNEGLGPVQYKMVWTFTKDGQVGTFKGNILGTMVAPLPTDNALTGLHGVLQGDGIFEGYKIVIEDGGRATKQPTTYTGFVQIP
jgi:hypothetical protein